MNNIQCNWCMETMYLSDTDTRDDCPKCNEVGFLMDKIEVSK
jgi:phage FluMu protein Com